MLNLKRITLMSIQFGLALQWGLVRGEGTAVELALHKEVVAVGEPVLVQATVTNSGREAVELIHLNSPSLNNLPICVIELRFGRHKDQLHAWRDHLRPRRETEPLLVKPGATETVEFVMLFDAKDSLFVGRAGLFWLQGRAVVAPSPYIEVLSDPVPIEILEPSPSDRTTWQWLDAHKEEYGRLVQIPWEAELSEEFVGEAGRLAETSRSVYAEYLALFLSRWYDEGKGKDAEQAARFAELAKAKASSEKVRSEAEKLLAKLQKRPTEPRP